jgi:hypothetical protein
LNIKVCFDVPYSFFYETFLILIRIQPDYIINVHKSSREVHIILLDLMNLEFSRQTSEKHSNIHENPSSGKELFRAEDRQT